MLISELLDSPEKWTQQACARDANDFSVSEWDTLAVSWCLVGAAHRCYGDNDADWILLRLRQVINGSPVLFNDSHTYAEVMDVVRKAGV